MKKYLLLVVAAIIGFCSAVAQSEIYYLDMKTDNLRYYFEYNTSKGLYTLTVPKLEGDFKIYNDQYVNGANDQDQYIFGAADGQSFGVAPGQTKRLSHPGSNMMVEGGGILYDVLLEFDPTNMTLNIVSGTSTAPDTPTTQDPPILIGQIDGDGNQWNPNYGVGGVEIMEGVYRYHCTFTGTGEFSFVTKLDSSWDVVNKYPRYAPSSKRVTAELNTWMPYTKYTGSTENAWQIENFGRSSDVNPDTYTILFSFPRESVKVVHGVVASVESIGINDIDAASNAPAIVYNLQGIPVAKAAGTSDLDEIASTLPAGIYIFNGKKLLIR